MLEAARLLDSSAIASAGKGFSGRDARRLIVLATHVAIMELAFRIKEALCVNAMKVSLAFSAR